MARELRVYLDGVPAGTLRQSPQGNTTFQYDDAYRNERRDRRAPTPLSLSMPLTRREHPNRVVLPFLQGLLPDSPTKLDHLARVHQTSVRNACGLLAHVGRDSAGAVQVLPPGEDSSEAATRRFPLFGLSKSRCFQESKGALSCLHCHDPHTPRPKALSVFDAACLRCHGGDPAPTPGATRPAVASKACPVSPKARCVACHMPSGRAMPHSESPVQARDHFIRIHREIAPSKR